MLMNALSSLSLCLCMDANKVPALRKCFGLIFSVNPCTLFLTV